ncbi:hypothetical protein OAT37_00765 [Alphaproteobacteria bacterium]|nr:hypothetical protein [Alphaproteobacteria bacterium]
METIYNNVVASPRNRITVHLHGALSQFGAAIDVIADTPIAAIAAVASLIDGFASHLRQGQYVVSDAHDQLICGADLIRPFKLVSDGVLSMRITPEATGSANGRGKAVLGLTLLGLSFIPGVQQGLTASFSALGQNIGGAQTATAFGQFGSQLLGRSGALLLLGGAADMLAPQDHTIAGQLRSSSITPPAVTGQGAAMPLVYGQTIIHHPIIISSGLSIETETH